MGKPREFRKILKKRGISKDHALYIGDESRDIEAAHAVGMKVISVLWGYNSKQALESHKPDFLADSGEDALEIVRSVHEKD